MAASEDKETDGQGAESASNLGSQLKSAREAQELSLEEIAAELRIGADQLSALESCRFDELGAPVFGKGYLKQYGARLGLNVAELVAEYEQSVAHQSVEISPSQTITLRDERQITVWIGSGVALLLMAATLWVWWWLGSDSEALPQPENPISETVPPLAAPQVEPESLPVFALEPESEPEPEPDPELAPALESVATLEPESTLEPEPQPELVAETLTAAVPEAVPIDGPQLDILFVGDSWTEITSATGERLFYDLGREGSLASVPADRGLNMFFGNAAGVELSVEGQPIPIPAAFRRGNLAQFNLDALVDLADLVDLDD